MAIGVETPATDPSAEPAAEDTISVVILIRPDEDEIRQRNLCTICKIFWTFLGIQLLRRIIMATSIAMMLLGYTHLFGCPISRFISIYFIWLGVSLLLYQICFVYNNWKSHNKTIQICRRIFGSTILIWFVAGSVFVYIVNLQNYDLLDVVYCDPEFYKFAFLFVAILYALAGLIALLIFKGTDPTKLILN